MRIIVVCSLAMALCACNQTSQTASVAGSGLPTANAALQELPPIYEPLVDMHRVNETKYRRDLDVCRSQAAPQERVARAAAKQAQSGAALSMIGGVLGSIPGSSYRQSQSLGSASGLLQNVGDAQAAQGAVTGDVALNDYALVVNTCLRHRGYALLR